MNYVILNPVRNITRKLGINKFIANLSYKKWYRQLEKDYNISKPSVVSIELGGVSISMNVESLSEYERVMSFKNDSKIINCILEQLSKEKDATFWDIGANIGLYSMFVANTGKTKKIVCFEPEPRCIDRIASNEKLNNLKNIQTYPVALGDEKGVFYLTTNEEFGAGNHSLINSSIGDNHKKIEVSVERGDNIILERKENIPTIVKIDVEGAEIKVLRGMASTLSNASCKMVICEVHFAILNSVGQIDGANEVIQLFKQYNFKNISWIDSSHVVARK